MKPDIDPKSIEMKEIISIKGFLDENFIYLKDLEEANVFLHISSLLYPCISIMLLVFYMISGGHQVLISFIISVVASVYFLALRGRFIKKQKLARPMVNEKIGVLKAKYGCSYQEGGYGKGNIHELSTNKVLHTHNGFFVKY